jgi:choline-phosphate cytidylyltransferase
MDAEFLSTWEIDYVAHDEEPYVSAGHDDVYSFVKEQGKFRYYSISAYYPHFPIGKFIPTRRTPGVSTSELLERIVSGYRKCDFDKKLEKMGHAELKAEGSDYDDRSSRATSRSMSPMPNASALSPIQEGSLKP